MNHAKIYMYTMKSWWIRPYKAKEKQDVYLLQKLVQREGRETFAWRQQRAYNCGKGHLLDSDSKQNKLGNQCLKTLLFHDQAKTEKYVISPQLKTYN